MAGISEQDPFKYTVGVRVVLDLVVPLDSNEVIANSLFNSAAEAASKIVKDRLGSASIDTSGAVVKIDRVIVQKNKGMAQMLDDILG